MKLSDYVADFLHQKKIEHAFVISGGASLHLIHSIESNPNIQHICNQHEQASAMAADAYSRVTGNMGVAIATSGPGATNLLTGVCSAYYDSVPVLCITGQVSTFRMKGDSKVRQIGFQETDAVEIFQSVTKYAVVVTDPKRIRYELEKAYYLAKEGRPGPVLVDIPDNIQREDIDPEQLEGFVSPSLKNDLVGQFEKQIQDCVQQLKLAKRPVMVLGWGIHLASARQEIIELIERLNIPFVPTWGVADILPSDHPLYIGTFGTHGTRPANFAVQNADLILSIGSRLDTKATGSPPSTFAREAYKIMVDIDENEINKFSKLDLKIDLPIHSDAKNFVDAMSQSVRSLEWDAQTEWMVYIDGLKSKYRADMTLSYTENDINPYYFCHNLSTVLSEDATIILDTGCTLPWMMQSFQFKKDQSLFHDWNNTAMGWALPAAIGAAFALNKPIICITGDGSFQMNIQELATIKLHNLPIKIILLNNLGHSMIRQTQDQWLDSQYVASSEIGGVPGPDYTNIVSGYGINSVDISKQSDLNKLASINENDQDSIFYNVAIDSQFRVYPQVKYGRPIEDSEPLLGRQEFMDNMIIDPVKE